MGSLIAETTDVLMVKQAVSPVCMACGLHRELKDLMDLNFTKLIFMFNPRE
jgi:hypothetical protein